MRLLLQSDFYYIGLFKKSFRGKAELHTPSFPILVSSKREQLKENPLRHFWYINQLPHMINTAAAPNHIQRSPGDTDRRETVKNSSLITHRMHRSCASLPLQISCLRISEEAQKIQMTSMLPSGEKNSLFTGEEDHAVLTKVPCQ